MQINSVSELCLQFVHIHFHISCVHADDSFFRSLRSSEKYICYISFNIFLDIVIIKCKSFFCLSLSVLTRKFYYKRICVGRPKLLV